jgi:hypothetical protein
MVKIFAVMTVVAATVCSGSAIAASSVYTKISDDTCVTINVDDESGGVSLVCQGHMGFQVHLQEGDLRQSVHFGFVGAWYEAGAWESFGQWNRTGGTVEWRVDGTGRPYATILRHFIENINPDTGSADESLAGQVLVVSRVAQPNDGLSCVVGYVDTRAASNANQLARDIADQLASDFACMAEEPFFHGEVGPTAGSPTRSFAQP